MSLRFYRTNEWKIKIAAAHLPTDQRILGSLLSASWFVNTSNNLVRAKFARVPKWRKNREVVVLFTP